MGTTPNTDNQSWAQRRATMDELNAEPLPEGIQTVDDLLNAADTEAEIKALFDTIPIYLLEMETKGAQSADPRAARLRKYWTVGEGGIAKIKWGTPGDGKRCISQLRKYLGTRAPGYCQNLHQQMVGGAAMGHGPGEGKEDGVEMEYGDYERDYEIKRQFTSAQRDKLAESGIALPDGSYPIENEEDLQNAVSAYGRAKDKEKAKAHIIKRARALGCTKYLPESWGIKSAVITADEIERALGHE